MTTTDVITMSKRELTRLEAIVAISEGRMSQASATALLGVTTRHIPVCQ